VVQLTATATRLRHGQHHARRRCYHACLCQSGCNHCRLAKHLSRVAAAYCVSKIRLPQAGCWTLYPRRPAPFRRWDHRLGSALAGVRCEPTAQLLEGLSDPMIQQRVQPPEPASGAASSMTRKLRCLHPRRSHRCFSVPCGAGHGCGGWRSGTDPAPFRGCVLPFACERWSNFCHVGRLKAVDQAPRIDAPRHLESNLASIAFRTSASDTREACTVATSAAKRRRYRKMTC
jgi:hypothetical protein